MDRITQPDERIDPASLALQAQSDPYSVLVKAIARASSDPVRFRKLVYVMAMQDLKSAAREPTPDPVKQATTLLELEEALQFEYAVARIEQHADAGANGETSSGQPRPGAPARGDTPRDRSTAAAAEQVTDLVADRLPAFLDPVTQVIPDSLEEAPPPRPSLLQSNWLPFPQLAIASAAALAFCAGIAGFVQWDRQAMATSAVAGTAAAQRASNQVATATRHSPETVGAGHPQTRPAAALPFPPPKAYSVYAESNGRITALQPLPISIPAGHFRTSEEITEASRTLVSGGDLKFVVYRRDLAPDALDTVSIRVVARVAHSLSFVNGKAAMTPVTGVWRVRDKTYRLKASPVEGNPQMVVMEPEAGTVLPSGRYALMLNGEGYDFTVPGPVTAMEQCLEQFQVQNGMILSECPKS